MQLLARLMDHVLAERGARATIVGATSGDTGGAAIEAFAGRDRTDIFILFPERARLAGAAAADDDVGGRERPCAGHRRQFRRLPGAGEGHVQRPRLPRPRVAVGRQLDQLGAHHGPDRLLLLVGAVARRPDRPVSFTVPTGNFGDIFAGYAAKRMGLPVERLVIATNDNDILARTLASGDYETREVVATTSPSMDIQMSSNFERLLFEASGRDAGSGAPLHGRAQAVRRVRHRGGAAGQASAPSFDAGRADDGRGRRDDPRDACRQRLPARSAHRDGRPCRRYACLTSDVPMVVLATAHPAKFPAAVEASIRRRARASGLAR